MPVSKDRPQPYDGFDQTPPRKPATQEELYRLYAWAEAPYLARITDFFNSAGFPYVTHRGQQYEPLALGGVTQKEMQVAIDAYKQEYALGFRRAQLQEAKKFSADELLVDSLQPLKERVVIVQMGSCAQIVDSGLVVIPSVADCLGVAVQVTTGECRGAIAATHWPMYAAEYGPGSPGQSMEVIKQTVDGLIGSGRATLDDAFGVIVCGLEYRPNQYLRDMASTSAVLDLNTDISPNPSVFKRDLVSMYGGGLQLSWVTQKLGSASFSAEKKSYTVYAATNPSIRASISELRFA